MYILPRVLPQKNLIFHPPSVIDDCLYFLLQLLGFEALLVTYLNRESFFNGPLCVVALITEDRDPHQRDTVVDGFLETKHAHVRHKCHSLLMSWKRKK